MLVVSGGDSMKVMKFGGSSVSDSERIGSVIEIILGQIELQTERTFVVFSAFGGVTDELIHMSQLAKLKKKSYVDAFEALKDRHMRVVENLVPDEDVQDQVKANVAVVLEELCSVIHGVYLVQEASARTLDYVMSFGERLSAYII